MTLPCLPRFVSDVDRADPVTHGCIIGGFAQIGVAPHDAARS
jgi:hypothetical protein